MHTCSARRSLRNVRLNTQVRCYDSSDRLQIREFILLDPDDQNAASELESFVKGLAETNKTIDDDKDRPLIVNRSFVGIPYNNIQYENLCREKKSTVSSADWTGNYLKRLNSADFYP